MKDETVKLLNRTDHVEAALSSAVIQAGVHVSDRQWSTLCKVTRQELAQRGLVPPDARKKRK